MSYKRLNLIFLFFLTIIFLALRISTLSATALTGLFNGFKFLIRIMDLSLIILPFHLLGLKALIGVNDNFF